jgi:hypothetical protein
MSAFVGSARKITIIDIENAANAIGCEVAAIRSVLSVESRNSGFDLKSRPIILFEPHVFYRNLPDNSERKRVAIHLGLAYAKWRKGNYPKGSAQKQSDGNYERLAKAIEIDEEAAYRAVSVGLGQILGENYKLVGFSSAKEMFKAAMESEGAQLNQMIAFIKSKRIDDDLRNKNWHQFALVYNGSGQTDKYAGLLASQYKKWSKIASVPREKITAKELSASGSRTISGVNEIKSAATAVTAAGATVSATITQAGDVVSQAKDMVAGFQSGAEIKELVVSYWPLFVALGVTALAAYFILRVWNAANKIEFARVEDARNLVNISR